jgi:hypothetical protein
MFKLLILVILFKLLPGDLSLYTLVLSTSDMINKHIVSNHHTVVHNTWRREYYFINGAKDGLTDVLRNNPIDYALVFNTPSGYFKLDFRICIG